MTLNTLELLLLLVRRVQEPELGSFMTLITNFPNSIDVIRNIKPLTKLPNISFIMLQQVVLKYLKQNFF